MTPRESHIAAIIAAPDDDAPRLAFADWLADNGDADRGEFIRLQIAVYRDGEQTPPVVDMAKHGRIRELFDRHIDAWLEPVYGPLRVTVPTNTPKPARKVTYSTQLVLVTHEVSLKPPLFHLGVVRGFVGDAYFFVDEMSPRAEFAPAFAAEPLTALTLNGGADAAVWARVHGPHLAGVRRLTVMLRGVDADGCGRNFARLITSPHLTNLRSLWLTGKVGAPLPEMPKAGQPFDPTPRRDQPIPQWEVDALREAHFRPSLRELTVSSSDVLRHLAEEGRT